MDTFLAHTSTDMHTPILISYFFFYPACFMIRLHRTHTTWAYDTPARGVRIKGLFPDDFVESPSLFKRNGYYYLTYGNDYSHPLSNHLEYVLEGPLVYLRSKKEGGVEVAACLLLLVPADVFATQPSRDLMLAVRHTFQAAAAAVAPKAVARWCSKRER